MIMNRIRYTSLFFHRIAVGTWLVVAASGCLSPLLFSRTADYLGTLQSIALPLLVVVNVFALRREINLIGALHVIALRERTSLPMRVGIMAIIVLCALSEVILKLKNLVTDAPLTSGTIFAGTAIALGIGASVVRAIIKSFKEHDAQVRERNTHPLRWVEARNLLVFSVGILPVLIAAAIVTLSVLALRHQYSVEGWIYYISGLVLLIAAYPSREYFVIACKRCGSSTTRALELARFCPRCRPDVFFQNTPPAASTPAAK